MRGVFLKLKVCLDKFLVYNILTKDFALNMLQFFLDAKKSGLYRKYLLS
jgi:hypothetical protein